MSLLSVKLTDVSTKGPPQLDPAVYTLESIKVGVNPPVGEKAAQIEVLFKDTEGEADGPTVRKIFSLSEKAKCYLKLWLLSCGRKDLANAEELDTDDLVGLVCQAAVGSRSWNDKDTGDTRTAAEIKKFIVPEDMKETD